jgi:hypothetical protein
MRGLRPHLLSVFFAVLFVGALAGQSVAGLAAFNEEQITHGLPETTYLAFVKSSDFVVDVAENWQSEFLQFFLFIFATIWLVQVGSPESKKPGDEGPGTDKEQLVGRYAKSGSPRWAKSGGWRTGIYSNSLLIVMGAIFLASWGIQSLAGHIVFNEEQADHGQPSITWLKYVASPDFWNRTLQNWQSEFLAVGCMIAFSIFLRQRGSAESKPVGSPHEESATSSE